MCLECGPLLKAINSYIQKADDSLADTLEEEGFVAPRQTLRYVQDIEEGVAEVLLCETDYFLAEAEKAVDLETFGADVWPGVKLGDSAKSKLTTVFRESFSEFLPEYIGYYIAQTDRDLKLEQVSKRTLAWVEGWSKELGAIMQLTSHREIESILEKGIAAGTGVAEFTRAIRESGIRDEYYKARRVAVTEALRAHSVAQQEAYMQSPAVKEKMWKHTGASRNGPRLNHVEMGGQRVPVDRPFELVGIHGGIYAPMYPRDTLLPPEESINCHCIVQPVVDGDILGLSLEERQRLQQEAIESMDDAWERELDAKNRARAGIDIEPFSTDVTALYSRKATPGQGKIIYGEGYKAKKHQAEIAKAKFLHDVFGGDVELLAESDSYGVKTADYRWNGSLWELKSTTTPKSADSAVRSALRQIQENPGGIILDYGDHKISIDELRRILISRFKRSGFDSLDIMVITDDDTTVKIYRHKK